LCFRSFTQVVQDKQFSALGLILVAELARIRRVVGFDLEEGEVAEDAEGKLVHGKSFLRSRGSEDLGEAVGRSTLAHPSIRLENSASAAAAPFGPCITGNIELSLGPAKGSPDVVGATMESALLLDPQGEERPAASKPQGSPKSAKRKRRKPANPIDDLFLGLD